MKFPQSFKRYYGSIPTGGIALGADSLPSGPPGKLDNVLSSRFSNINGWPVQRIAVVYAGPASPPVLTARMYFYEDNTQAWHQIGAQQSLTANVTAFFDCVALLDMPSVQQNLAQGGPGSILHFLQVDLVGTVSGAYTFALAPDLTSQA